MSFFVLMMIFFAVTRLLRRYRFRHRHGLGWGWHPHGMHRRMSHYQGMQFQTVAPTPAARPAESAFDILKRRYVKGELSDEQYESELDDLLKTPEGRSQV